MRLQAYRTLIGATFLLLGCQPSIGDHCIQSTDCSPQGDRLCDTSQPNGYCTLFNCLPNDCPSGSGCMLINAAVNGCAYDDRHAPSRLASQLCLKTCNEDSDCRTGEGYACIVPAEYGILSLDTLIPNEKVCLPQTSYVASDAAPDVIAPVCSASGPTVPPIDAGPGYQGNIDAGADAQVDAQADAGDAQADAADAASE